MKVGIENSEGMTPIDMEPHEPNVSRANFINTRSYTWGLYCCDRCGYENTCLCEKGATPPDSFPCRCSPWYVFWRKKGREILMSVLG